MMNRSFYLKLVALAVIITGFSIAYSIKYMSIEPVDVETINYSQLSLLLNTSHVVYEQGEPVNATIFLRNTYNYTVYVEPFSVNLVGYIKHEDITALHGSTTKHVQEIIEIPALSDYKVTSSIFTPTETGVLTLSMGEVNRSLYVIDGIDEKYWDMKPELFDSLQWEHKNPSVNFVHWFAIAETLRDIEKSPSLDYFTDIFVNKYPDWINGTAYIALADTREEFTQPILEEINPSDRAYVRIIKAPTTLRHIEQLERLIFGKNDILEFYDVRVNGMMIHIDGRLMVGIENVSEEKLETLAHVLKEIPPGIIIGFEMGPVQAV